jgi:carboxyl-terminal processing protease
MTNRFSRNVLLAILVIFGTLAVGGAYQNSDSFFQIKRSFAVFSEVFQEVTLRYVDEINPDELIRTGIDAMLESLDPYTVLIDQAESQQLEVLTRGSYAGIGIEVGARGGRLVVVAPLDGYAAHRQGIRAGDVILKVDEISIESLSVDDLQSLIAGEPGSWVSITIERFGIDQPMRFDLVREQVEVRNVLFYTFLDEEQTIGYVALSRFGQNAATEVRAAISALRTEGSMQGLVLDLRNNPGGLLDEAVKMVDLFIGPGQEVVRTQGRGIESTFRASTESPVFYDGPLVVLQNNGSASSSEIVSGALQDYDRAILAGERSFGKGLVQVVRSLSYNTTLKITTSRYYIPSGRSIQSASYNPENPEDSYQLPDSLRNSFSTRAGRTVYDGVGIDPDVRVFTGRSSLFETALLRQNTYFFFANEYRSEYDAFPYDVLPDYVFDAFIDYLMRSGFTYESRTQYHLSGMREQLQEQDNDDVHAALELLQQLLVDEKMNRIQTHHDEISRQLYLELISRYYPEQQKARIVLKNDVLIHRVLELFESPDKLVQFLTP